MYDETVQVEEFLISSGHGIYIPQMFAELFSKRNEVPDWAWDTCKKGPINKDDSGTDNYDYWDAWSEILDKWDYEDYDGCGNKFRYFLDASEDLCLMRQFIDHEPLID
jgi:hypothetical protein